MERYVDNYLQEEINLKVNKIQSSPEYYDARRSLVIEDIRSIGDVYSFWIENPSLRKTLLTENKQPETLRKLANKGIQNVNNGWYYLSRLSKQGNFVKDLTPYIIQKLNKNVLGDSGEFNEFRNKRVSLNILDYTPPSPEKVPKKIKAAISRIKEVHNNYGALESAITAHLELAAIQPFMDGNKRVARLIQDRILFDCLLPPVIITAGEGKYYRDLLCKTLPAYDDNIIEGQREFYNYCASKVNNGLDEILGDLIEEPAIRD